MPQQDLHRHTRRLRLPSDPAEKSKRSARQTPEQMLAKLTQAMARLEKSILRGRP